MLCTVNQTMLRAGVLSRDARTIRFVRRAMVGRTVAETAEELGVPRFTLYRWLRDIPELSAPADPTTKPDDATKGRTK